MNNWDENRKLLPYLHNKNLLFRNSVKHTSNNFKNSKDSKTALIFFLSSCPDVVVDVMVFSKSFITQKSKVPNCRLAKDNDN
jgi:hypothetical protein